MNVGEQKTNLREYWSLARAIALAVFALLLPAVSLSAEPEKFEWQRTDLFQALEIQFSQARNKSAKRVELEFAAISVQSHRILSALSNNRDQTPFKNLAQLEEIQFQLAALAAAQPLCWKGHNR